MAGAYKYRPQYTQNTIGPSPGPKTPSINHEAEMRIIRECVEDLRFYNEAVAERPSEMIATIIRRLNDLTQVQDPL